MATYQLTAVTTTLKKESSKIKIAKLNRQEDKSFLGVLLLNFMDNIFISFHSYLQLVKLYTKIPKRHHAIARLNEVGKHLKFISNA